MTLSEETFRFIGQHRHDDLPTLALQARKYPQVDMPAAITQLAGRRVACDKVPLWAETEEILYPPHLSLEQCSSQQTAQYKASIIAATRQRQSLVDLTGGFGIDCAFLATHFAQATYVEQQEVLCQIAAHNFPVLGLNHIKVCRANSVEYLQSMPVADWIFIDPARRDGQGGKIVAIAHCEPNVALLEPQLLEKATHVLIKLSPMLDLTLALHDLKQVHEAYVVSVGNECKELLLRLGSQKSVAPHDVRIHCINLQGAHGVQSLAFTRGQEQECACLYADEPGAYLYEPNSSILKAGAFRTTAHIYKVKKLHPNSHLYTSDNLVEQFPGRTFAVTGHCGLHKKEIKELLGGEKKANLTVRNFPATVAELRKRWKLAEGGDTYLFATTTADERKLLLRCRKMAH